MRAMEDDDLIPVSNIRPLADGIYAIIVTLLVLDLRLPEHVGDGRLLAELWAMRWTFTAVWFAFLYLVFAWLSMNGLFDLLKGARVRPPVAVAMLLPAGSMALIPLVASALATSVHDRANLITAGQLLAAVLFLNNCLAFWLHALLIRAGHFNPGPPLRTYLVQMSALWLLPFVLLGALAVATPVPAIVIAVIYPLLIINREMWLRPLLDRVPRRGRVAAPG
jgi:uncharacterized membrane protein